MRSLIVDAFAFVLVSITVYTAPVLGADLSATRPAAKPPAAPADRVLHDNLDLMLPPVSFEGVGLSDAFDFLRDVNGANIFVDWKRLEAANVKRATPITLKLKNVKFTRAVELVLDATGAKEKLVARVQEGVIIISTKEGAAIAADALKGTDLTKWDKNLREILEERILPVNFDEVPLSDALQYLNDQMKAKIDVDWKGFEKIGVDRNRPVTLKVFHIRYEQVVRLIFASVGAHPIEITPKDGGIHIAPAPKP